MSAPPIEVAPIPEQKGKESARKKSNMRLKSNSVTSTDRIIPTTSASQSFVVPMEAEPPTLREMKKKAKPKQKSPPPVDEADMKTPWWSSKTFRLMVMLSMTLSFFFVELVFGLISKSMALVADSFHMLSDVLALLIAFACMKISRRKSSANTFGWVRAEVLGALVNAVFLLALCFSIAIEAIKRLCEPDEIQQPLNVLIVGIVGLVVNVIGIFMFHGHASVGGHSHARPVPLDLDEEEADAEQELQYQALAQGAHSISVLQDSEEEAFAAAAVAQPLVDAAKGAKGAAVVSPPSGGGGHGHSHDAGQLNMHGVFLHILGDAFGSVIVIINALICWQVDDVNVRLYLDPSLSLVMVLIISSTTIPLLRESCNILLQSIPPHLNLPAIRDSLLKIDGILAVHDFHVWRLAGNKIIATAHIQVRSLEDYMRLATAVKTFFHNQGIHSTTIQPEFHSEVHEEVAAVNGNCAIACATPCTVDVMCCDGSPPATKDKMSRGSDPTQDEV